MTCACNTDCRAIQRTDMTAYTEWSKVWTRKMQQTCDQCGQEEPAGGFCSQCGHYPRTAQWHPNKRSEGQYAYSQGSGRFSRDPEAHRAFLQQALRAAEEDRL